MLIQWASDLHLEFPLNKQRIFQNPIRPAAEILILAGDVLPLCELTNPEWDPVFDKWSKDFKQVYWVPGNHEYYGYNIDKFESGKISVRQNITILNQELIYIKTVPVYFSTLWSRITPESQFAVQKGMADFRYIAMANSKISINKYNYLHEMHLNGIKKLLKDYAVIVTHHVPTFLNYPPIHLDSPINCGFATELGNMIADSELMYWIYGHNHGSVDPFKIGKCELMTNQLGYVHRNEHLNFNETATFKI